MRKLLTEVWRKQDQQNLGHEMPSPVGARLVLYGRDARQQYARLLPKKMAERERGGRREVAIEDAYSNTN